MVYGGLKQTGNTLSHTHYLYILMRLFSFRLPHQSSNSRCHHQALQQSWPDLLRWLRGVLCQTARSLRYHTQEPGSLLHRSDLMSSVNSHSSPFELFTPPGIPSHALWRSAQRPDLCHKLLANQVGWNGFELPVWWAFPLPVADHFRRRDTMQQGTVAFQYDDVSPSFLSRSLTGLQLQRFLGLRDWMEVTGMCCLCHRCLVC